MGDESTTNQPLTMASDSSPICERCNNTREVLAYVSREYGVDSMRCPECAYISCEPDDYVEYDDLD